MEDNNSNTQGNGNSLSFNLPNMSKVVERIGKFDEWAVPGYTLLVYLAMGWLGVYFMNEKMLPSDIDVFNYVVQTFAGLATISLVTFLLTAWESLKRNDFQDSLWVIAAIVVNIVAITQFGTWLAVMVS